MQKSLLIFDLDGTLIDSVPDLALAINMTLGKIGGMPTNETQVRNWVGNGSKKLVERALHSQLLATDDNALHIAHELFLNSYAHHTCDKTVGYAGVDQGLRQLKSHGFTLAICTNKPIQFLPTILQTMDWEELFEVVVGGDSLPTKKPDPAPLHYICQKLGKTTEQSIMIGDSKNDILAGKNAGMTTFALSYGYNYDEPISHSNPDMIFDDFDALTRTLIHTYGKA